MVTGDGLAGASIVNLPNLPTEARPDRNEDKRGGNGSAVARGKSGGSFEKRYVNKRHGPVRKVSPSGVVPDNIELETKIGVMTETNVLLGRKYCSANSNSNGSRDIARETKHPHPKCQRSHISTGGASLFDETEWRDNTKAGRLVQYFSEASDGTGKE